MLLGVCLTAHAAPPEPTNQKPRIILATIFSEFLSGLRAIAPDFEAETGYALEIQGIPYLSYQMWLQTRFLGKNAPDVLLLDSTGDAWRFGQAGLLVRFDDIVTKPNPFSDATTPWKDDFRQPYVQQAYDVNGHLYLVPYTQYGVGFFYNKKLYAQANVEPPRTWDELLSAFNRLKQQGTPAFLAAVKPDDAQTVWIASILLECFTRIHIPEVNLRPSRPDWRFDPLDRACTLAERIDLSETIVAFERGIIDPAKAPEFAETARIIKDMSSTWRPDFLSLSGELIYKSFASGRAATMMNGTWYLGEFSILEDTIRKVTPEAAFDCGTFPFPEITPATSALARAGGINQNAGMRACLLAPKQEDPARADAGVLLCHYLTAPRVARKVFENSFVYDIPTVTSVEPKPEATPLLPKAEFAFLPVCNFVGYDSQCISEFWSLWQQYLGGTIPLDEFLACLSQKQRASLVRVAELYKSEIDYEFVRQQLGRSFP